MLIYKKGITVIMFCYQTGGPVARWADEPSTSHIIL